MLSSMSLEVIVFPALENDDCWLDITTYLAAKLPSFRAQHCSNGVLGTRIFNFFASYLRPVNF